MCEVRLSGPVLVKLFALDSAHRHSLRNRTCSDFVSACHCAETLVGLTTP